MNKKAPSPNSTDSTDLSIISHLKELRKRLLISIIALVAGTVVCFIFYNFIIRILYRPFQILDLPENSTLLYVNSIFEGLLTKLKISFFSGIILSFPLHLYNVVKFIFPGLRPVEKKVIIISLLASFLLIIFSSYYSYFQVIPLSISFLTGSGFIPGQVGMLLNYRQNIFYIFQFLFVTLVLFQMPVLLEVLMVMKVVKRRFLLRASRYIIVIVFVISALLTPPDFISQLALALPLVGLYFFTILVAKIFRFGEE